MPAAIDSAKTRAYLLYRQELALVTAFDAVLEQTPDGPTLRAQPDFDLYDRCQEDLQEIRAGLEALGAG